MKCPVFKFVPIHPCPVTGKHWGKAGFVFFTLPGRYLYILISLLLSRLSCLSGALNHLLDLFQHVHTSFTLGSQSWTQHSPCTSLGPWCPPSTCQCHSSQFSWNVDNSLSWSILWSIWELSPQICCALSHGCCEVLVPLGLPAALMLCVDSSGSWERAAICGCRFWVCSAAYWQMAALGSYPWKRVLEGVKWKELGDLGEARHRWQCCGAKDLADFAILKFQWLVDFKPFWLFWLWECFYLFQSTWKKAWIMPIHLWFMQYQGLHPKTHPVSVPLGQTGPLTCSIFAIGFYSPFLFIAGMLYLLTPTFTESIF